MTNQGKAIFKFVL